MGRRLLLICFCLLLPALVWGQAQADDNWLQTTIETCRTQGWLAEDEIGVKLWKPKVTPQKAPQTTNDQDLSLRLTQFASQLSVMDSTLAGLGGKLENSREALRQRKAQQNIYSEVRGNLEWTPGNGGAPRIYNAIRFRPQLDTNTQLGIMLYMRNGLGTDEYDQLTVFADEFWLSTKIKWQNQSYDLLLGNYFVACTPFTIYRNYRLEDTHKESRISLNGLRGSGKILGLDWLGFLARTTDGKNGTAFDRFLLYNYASTHIEGGEVGLGLMRVFDDLGASNLTKGAYSSSTLSLTGNYRNQLLGAGYNLRGEANLNRLDHDITQGPWPSTNYAVRLSCLLDLPIPLNMGYWAVSEHYPTTNTAIETIDADYIYQYEENPYELFYLSNYQHLELSLPRIPLCKWGHLTGNVNWNQELKAQTIQKQFGHLGLTHIVEPASVVPLAMLQGLTLQTELGTYRTQRGEDFSFKQDRSIFSVSFPQTRGVSLTLGYEWLFLDGTGGGQGRQQRTDNPFLLAAWAPLSGTSVLWRYEPRTLLENKVATAAPMLSERSRHKVELKSNIAPFTSLTVRYEQIAAEKTSSNLYLDYRTGF